MSLIVLASSATLTAATADQPPRRGAKGAAGTVGVPPALLPDARALKANDLVITHDRAGHRVLRYESGLVNVGAGPLEVRPNDLRPCPGGQRHASQIIYRDRDHSGHFSRRHDTRVTRHSAGCMVFHPTHNHWHFEAAARYVLYRPAQRQPLIVTGRKMSFCLRDSRRAPDRWPTADYKQFYGDCSRSSPQGISIGWADIYQNFLPGQAIRLPDRLRNGIYCLRTVVDPRDELLETDNTDNTSIRGLRLRGSSVSIRPSARCR